MGGGIDPLGHGRFRPINTNTVLPRFYSGAKAYDSYFKLEGHQFVSSPSTNHPGMCLGRFGDYVYFSSTYTTYAPLCIYTNGSLQHYEKYSRITDSTAISSILDLLPESWCTTLGTVECLYQYRHDDLIADGIGYNR